MFSFSGPLALASIYNYTAFAAPGATLLLTGNAFLSPIPLELNFISKCASFRIP